MPDLVTITCDIQAIYHEGKPSETTVRLFENSDGSSGNNGPENESEVIIKRNYYQESSIIKLVRYSSVPHIKVARKNNNIILSANLVNRIDTLTTPTPYIGQ